MPDEPTRDKPAENDQPASPEEMMGALFDDGRAADDLPPPEDFAPARDPQRFARPEDELPASAPEVEVGEAA
ncbi:MAG: hypothetical protein J4G18_07315, partial [Anaerolineae bacterium]|nr:hypothetical protein [Anaerolineae bacterium]